MIISASYKTDIPAFYGEWFRNRLRAGYCRMVNPYNRQQQQLVSLRKDDVDGFVFWTKNLQPFVSTLSEVYQQGFPFVVQYTINGYPRALETRVVDTDRSVACFRSASNRYGADSMIWRYDPIVLSTITDREFHLNNFAALANGIVGIHIRSCSVVHATVQENPAEPRNRCRRTSLPTGRIPPRIRNGSCLTNS